MLLTQLLIQHPAAIVDIVRQTPTWVAGLLAGLLWLGFSAVRTRNLHIGRLVLMPVAMGGMALWGVTSAFHGAGQLAELLALWLVCYAAVLAASWPLRAPHGTRYDAAGKRFHLPGSWMPMLLILAIFLMKYAIGVQLAMAPELAANAQFALVVTALYGALSGLTASRALRVLRLAHPRTAHLVASRA